MDQKMESIKKEIRSVLISYPKGVSLEDFRRTYKELLGVRLPTREFGFTLDIDFLHSIPDVVHIEVDRNGTNQLFVLADDSTKHIKKLVGKQRATKPKTSNKFKSSSGYQGASDVARSRVPTTRCRPFVPAVLRAEIIQVVKLYPDGIGYTAFMMAYRSMFHRAPNLTFLSADQHERLQKLANAIPDLEVRNTGGQDKLYFVDQSSDDSGSNGHPLGVRPSLMNFKDINKATSSTSKSQSNGVHISESMGITDISAVPEFMKYNIKKILNRYPEGILAVHFPILYENFTRKTFDLHELGYNCLLDLVDALPDILVRVQSPECANDWILYHVDFSANIADARQSPVPPNVQPSHINGRLSNLKEKAIVKIALPALQYVQPELSSDADEQYFPVFISAFVNPSLFWFQLQTDDAINNLNTLEKEMEYFYNSQLRSDYLLKDADILIGSSCVAHFPADHHWYRCVISSLLNTENVKVFLVDYGSWETIPRSRLYYLKYSFILLPAQAFQAQLALLQPHSRVGTWEINAQKRFLELCNKSFIMAKVNSMQYKVASVFLCDTCGEEEIHINQTLVFEGLAEYQTEDNARNSQSAMAPAPQSAVNGSCQANAKYTDNCQTGSSYSNSLNDQQKSNHASKEQLVNKLKTLQLKNHRRCVRRILLHEGFHIHIIIVENQAFVSQNDLCHLLWKDKEADVLACRLEFKGVTIPVIIISKDKFPDLFSQCEKYNVGGFTRNDSSYCVNLYPLKYSIKVLNAFGHPSSDIRETLIQEMKEFNPLSSVWSESVENGEHYEVSTDKGEKNLDRLCSFDLKIMREGLICKRLKLQACNKGKQDEEFSNQMKQIELTQDYISRRIKEIEEICLKYSEEIS